MPITQRDKRTLLEQRIGRAIELVNPKMVLDFCNQLTPEEDKFVPQGSTITFLEITQSALKTLIKKDIRVKTYKSKWPWSKARAYTTGKNININKRKNHTVATLTKTFAHEVIHISDIEDTSAEYDHGNNENQHLKKNTAPILFATMYVLFLEEKGLL